MNVAFPLFMALLFLLNTSASYGQGCCTVGASSLGGLESGVQPYKTLSFSANYQFNSLTRSHQGTTKISDPLKRTAQVGFFSIQAEYGLQPRLSILAAINYGGKIREITVVSGTGGSRFTETISFEGSGFGDILAVVKYQIVRPDILNPFELAFGGGASLPTGSYTLEHNGSQLSVDLQPGTGALALIGWAFAMRSFPDIGARAVGMFQYRYAGTNLDGYRIGDEVVVHLGGEYSATEHFSGSIYLRSRFARQDYASRRILSATGGSYLDFMPGIGYADGPSSGRVFAQLPVYRNVRGIQLTTTYMIGIEYRYTFDFRGLVDVIVPEL